MTFSYTGDPRKRDLDMVRFLLQDTECSTSQFTDEEINALLEVDCNPYMAAANAADVLGSRYARVTHVKIGDYEEDGGTMSQNYYNLAKTLRTQARRRGVTFYAGGLSIAEREADQADADLEQPSFSKGMDDNLGGVNIND